MKKRNLILSVLLAGSCLVSKAQPLKGVTVGLGIGYNRLLKTPCEYYLTSDAAHTLQVQQLSKSGMVLSSVLSFKLFPIAVETQTDAAGQIERILVYRNKIVANNNGKTNAAGATHPTAKFHQRLAVNIGLNLAELSNGNVAFNKYIDGGVGLGYYFNEFAQLALSLDFIRVREIRETIVTKYLGNSIPNGADVFNALDKDNSSLFYNRYIPGVSVKFIFTVNNQ